MKLWLLVPVKPFGKGKSRLAGVLSPARRGELMREWLGHVLVCARACSFLAGVIVISRDSQVHRMAQAIGAIPLVESGYDLNQALHQARQAAMLRQAEGILVLPADLPRLTTVDIEQLYSLAADAPCVVIAPGRNGGTNALLLRPPMSIDFAFGPGSFRRHSDLADAQNIPRRVYDSPTLAFDVDVVEDLVELYSLER